MSEVKYYRSQIIAGDPSTKVYWGEDEDGSSFDVLATDVPPGAIVTDVSYRKPEHYRKTDTGDFVREG